MEKSQDPVRKLTYFALFKKRLGTGPEQGAWSKNLHNGPDEVLLRPE